MPTLTQRSQKWDILKFFMIFLVVLGHVAEFFTAESQGMRNLFTIIYTVHMPIFIFVAGLFYRIKKTRKFAFIGAMVGNLAMAVSCFLINLYITYPIYMEILIPEQVILGMYQAILPSMDSIWKSILVFNVPFTFAKGLVSVIITFLIYRKLSPILKGNLQNKS